MNTQITLTRNKPPQKGMIPSYTITWQIDILQDYPATATQTETPWIAYHLLEILLKQGYTLASSEAYQRLLKDKDAYIQWWQTQETFDTFDQTDNPNDGLEDHDRIPDLDDDDKDCA